MQAYLSSRIKANRGYAWGYANCSEGLVDVDPIVAVTEGPSDEVAAATALSIASKGNAKTTTMRAFTESEFSEIVKKVS